MNRGEIKFLFHHISVEKNCKKKNNLNVWFPLKTMHANEKNKKSLILSLVYFCFIFYQQECSFCNKNTQYYKSSHNKYFLAISLRIQFYSYAGHLSDITYPKKWTLSYKKRGGGCPKPFRDVNSNPRPNQIKSSCEFVSFEFDIHPRHLEFAGEKRVGNKYFSRK